MSTDADKEHIYWINWIIYLDEYDKKHPQLKSKDLLRKAGAIYTKNNIPPYDDKNINLSRGDLFRRSQLLDYFLKNRNINIVDNIYR